MNGMMIHCGAHGATEYDVKNAVTPEQTGRHFPIAHWDLLSHAKSAVEEAGFHIGDTGHALTPSGDRYFGLLKVGGEGMGNDDFEMVMGLRNSHDKRFRASVAFGNQVFVCDNLCFSGEAVVGRRHTRNIMDDIPELFTRCVGKLLSHKNETVERMAAYRQAQLSPEKMRSTVVRAIEGGVLPQSKLLKVVREFRDPTYPEHGENGDSVWKLSNAFTEASKGRNIFNLSKSQHVLQGILDPLAGFAGQSFASEIH